MHEEVLGICIPCDGPGVLPPLGLNVRRSCGYVKYLNLLIPRDGPGALPLGLNVRVSHGYVAYMNVLTPRDGPGAFPTGLNMRPSHGYVTYINVLNIRASDGYVTYLNVLTLIEGPCVLTCGPSDNFPCRAFVNSWFVAGFLVYVVLIKCTKIAGHSSRTSP